MRVERGTGDSYCSYGWCLMLARLRSEDGLRVSVIINLKSQPVAKWRRQLEVNKCVSLYVALTRLEARKIRRRHFTSHLPEEVFSLLICLTSGETFLATRRGRIKNRSHVSQSENSLLFWQC